MNLCKTNSRAVRRAQLSGRDRRHAFSRTWRCALPAALLVAFLPTSPVAIAAPSATYQSTGDGNYTTPGNFKNASGVVVVPDGTDGNFYDVSNTTGQAITFSKPSGTATVSSIATNGDFSLTAGTLSGLTGSSLFTLTGAPLFQIGSGATLRKFTVTGGPLTVNGTATLDNVTTKLNGVVSGTLTFANATQATVAGGQSLALGTYNDGTDSLLGVGTLILGDGTGTGTVYIAAGDQGVVGTGMILRGINGVIMSDPAQPASSGYGQTFTNNGTLTANTAGGMLTLQNLAGFTNAGLMSATGGGTVSLSVDTTNTGTLSVGTGSTFALSNLALSGSGAMTSTGTGKFTLDNVSLSNVTSAGALNVLGGNADLLGTLTNNGTLLVTGGHGLYFGSYNNGMNTLAGTGTVTLGDGMGTGSFYVAPLDQGVIGAGVTVNSVNGALTSDPSQPASAGYGQTLTNNGTLQATGGTLAIQNLVSFTNAGTVAAGTGAVSLSVDTVNTGTLSVGVGGTFALSNLSLSGSGTLASTGTGKFTLANVTLTDVTLSGTLNVIDDSRLLGTLTNNGTLLVTGGHALYFGSYNNGTNTLVGTNTVTLGDGTGTGSFYVAPLDQGVIGSGVTVNSVNGVITSDLSQPASAGYGQTLTSNGALQVPTGGTLTIQNLAGFTNTGSIAASGTGTLTLQGLAQFNNSGPITFGTGGGSISDSTVSNSGAISTTGTLSLTNVVLTDNLGAVSGTLTATGSGAFNLNNVSLVDATVSGPVHILGGDARLLGTLTDNGTVSVAGSHGLYFGIYNNGTNTLSGTNTVTLGDGMGTGSFYVAPLDQGVIGSGVTVSSVNGALTSDPSQPASAGYGQTLTNNGSVLVSGSGTLAIQNLVSFTNAGTVAVGMGTGTLSVDTVNTGTLSVGAGGTFALSNLSLSGSGTLTSTGTGKFTLDAVALTNVSGTATLNIIGDSRLLGTLTDNGTMSVAGGHALYFGIYNNGTNTLAGTNTVTLGDGTGTGSFYIAAQDQGVIGSGVTVNSVNGVITSDPSQPSSAGYTQDLVNNGTLQAATGGTLTIQNLTSFTENGTLAAANGGMLTSTVPFATGSAGTFSVASGGTITGLGDLTQSATSGAGTHIGTSQIDGTLNLQGGTLTIASGSLQGSGTISGSVVVAGGSTAATQGTINLVDGAIHTLTLQNTAGSTALTLGGASTGNVSNLNFDIGPGATSDKIAVASTNLLTVNSGGAKINLTGLNGFGTGTYNLLTFGSGNASGLSSLSLGTKPNAGGGLAYALSSTTTAERLVVTVAAATANAYWRGSQNSTWNTITNGFTNFYSDTTGTTNTALPGAITDLAFNTTNVNTANLNTSLGQDFSIKGLTFTNAATIPVTIGGANTLTLGTDALTVQNGAASPTISANIALGVSQTWTNNSANALTVSGIISGPSKSLTTTGTGKIVLTGANTYSGGTTINGGTLSGTTTSLQGAVANNATLDVTQATSGTLSSPISGGGNVTVGNAASTSAGAVVTMTGANTYTGGTTVNGGTLSGTAASYSSGGVTVNSGATADYTQNAASTYAASITGNGSVTVGGNAGSPNGTGGTITYTGIDSAASTTVKSGALVLNHSGGGALTGPVAVATGATLSLGSSNQIQEPSANTLTLAGGTLAANGHSDGTPTVSALGKLLVTGPDQSTLDFGDPLGTNPTTLAFADSSSLTWTGIVTVTNYTIGVDQLYIGTSKTLSADQLSRIRFAGDGYPSRQFATGQVVAPEPSGFVSLLVGTGILGTSLLARRRRKGATA